MVDRLAQSDLREWLHQLREDRLGDEQGQHLAARLRESSEARQIYARYMILQACLELDWGRLDASTPLPDTSDLLDDAALELAEAELSPAHEDRTVTNECIAGLPAAAPLPASSPSPTATQNAAPILGFLSRPIDLATAWVASPKAIALTVLGGLLTYFGVLVISVIMGRIRSGPHDAQLAGQSSTGAQAERAAAASVGALRTGRKASWSGNSPTDSVVRVQQRYELGSGKVEVMLSHGTRVVLEGPATWQLNSEKQLSLEFGKLLATVPPAGKGFTVVTPVAEIVDLGTQFAVEVIDRQDTRLVVKQGAVRLTAIETGTLPAAAPQAGQVAEAEQIVKAGQSARVSRTSAGKIVLESTLFEDAWASELAQFEDGAAAAPQEVIAFQAYPPGASGTSPGGVDAVGTAFRVERPIQIFSLGVFDHLGDGIDPGSDMTALLWSYDDQDTPQPRDDKGLEILARATFTAADPGVLRAGHRFKRLAEPVTLERGLYCLIVHGILGENTNFGSPLFDALPEAQRGERPRLEVETCRYAIVPLGWRFFERPPTFDDFPPFFNSPPVFYFAGSFTFAPLDDSPARP